MADFHLTPPGDNPALTDPIYAEAHKPRRYVMFSGVLDANGEIRFERLEGLFANKPAELIVQSVNSDGDKNENGSTAGEMGSGKRVIP